MKKIIFILVFFTSCNQKEISLQEKKYNEVSDSLSKYKSEIRPLTPEISDFIKLDYENFREKYSASEKDMNALLHTYTVTYQTISAAQSIREVFEQLDELNSELSKMEKESDTIKKDYKFNLRDFKNLKE